MTTPTTPHQRLERESKVEQEIIADTRAAIGDLNKRRATYKRPAVRDVYARSQSSRDKALEAAARRVELLAGYRNEVRDHVALELAMTADGTSDHTPLASDPEVIRRSALTGKCATYVHLGEDVWHLCGRSRPCGEHDAPVSLTAVERAADRRLRLQAQLADFDAQCKLIDVASSDAMQSRDRIMRTHLATETADVKVAAKCCDGQVGKAGVFEWGEPTCEADGVKSGMCQAHYWKWYRWRRDNGQKTPEIEDVA